MARSGDQAWVVLEVHEEPQRMLEDCACFLEDGRWFADSLGTRLA
jgi:hypothetical protein